MVKVKTSRKTKFIRNKKIVRVKAHARKVGRKTVRVSKYSYYIPRKTVKR